jgi:ACS family hexuronate transporter-like MFS transporter
MSTTPVSPYTAADRMRWAALALVFTAAMINYIDRQAIAVLKPVLEAEFGWSAQDYAHIVSGFQLATIASILAVGWFVDRVGLRSGYAIGVAAWSLAGMAHAVVTTITGFIGVRIILGVTEAVNTPAAVKTVATWFRGKDRSLALGIMNTAPNIGAVATPLLVPAIAIALGWKMAFIITGALGFVWLAFWLLLPKPPAASIEPISIPVEEAAAPKAGIKDLLRDRRAWAIALAKLMTDFVFAFMLFWAPDLFARRYGLDMAGFALPIATIFLMAAGGSLFGGWLSSALLRRGHSLNISRKVPMSVSALCALPAPLVMITPEPWAAVALVGLVLAAHQCFSTNVFGLITDIFPSRMVGLVAGFGATFGGLSGLAMLEFTGFVLDTTGSYLPMLLLCGFAYVTALTTLHLMVPDIDRAKEGSSETSPPISGEKTG